ncbi:MAG: hypothetical protein M0022_04965, partial [Desulfobacteraceae bacterium]|nr:hypothetical protein [Desulfobacteraceae bacterium]
MSNKEYTVIEILDVLRRFKAGDGFRAIAKGTGIARNTVRKYIRSAGKKGLEKDADLDLEETAYAVFREVHAADNNDDDNIRDSVLLPHKESITDWINQDRLTVTKAHIKLLRLGVGISYSSLYRFVQEHIGAGDRGTV